MSGYKSLLPYVAKHRWPVFWGVVFVFSTNLTGLAIPILIGEIVNWVSTRSIDQETLLSLVIGLLALAGITGGFRFLMRRVLIDMSRDVEYEIRNSLFAKLQKLDAGFFDRNNTGDLMSRATNDMDAVRMLLGPGVMYTANALFSLPLAIAGMLYMDWKLTLLAMIPMLGLPPMVKYFGGRTHEYSLKQQDSFGKLTTMVQENLAGIRVVKAYRREAYELNKFSQHNDDYIEKSLKLAWIQSIFFPAIRVLVGLGYAVLILVGGRQIMDGTLQVGTLFAFLILFAQLVWPLIAAGWVVNIIQRGLASLERINLILQTPPSVADGNSEVPTGPLTIEFRNMTFQYDGTSKPQLSDITLLATPGKTIGIVGPVGSGKSTLVNLLTRFYPIPRGQLFLGGIDINDWPLVPLRKKIAFVFQETFLFSDTIASNIRFGAPENTPQEAVESVAIQAQVHDNVINFPKQYETVLGERGVNLSGGQKQRVAIARALLREAPVLVLDDSLSAVDTHTEEAILGHLREVMGKRTTFLISHRISTVSLADEVLVLEEGKITQRGTHADLITQPGLYGELYRRQLSERAVDEYSDDETEAAHT